MIDISYQFIQPPIPNRNLATNFIFSYSRLVSIPSSSQSAATSWVQKLYCPNHKFQLVGLNFRLPIILFIIPLTVANKLSPISYLRIGYLFVTLAVTLPFQMLMLTIVGRWFTSWHFGYGVRSRTFRCGQRSISTKWFPTRNPDQSCDSTHILDLTSLVHIPKHISSSSALLTGSLWFLVSSVLFAMALHSETHSGAIDQLTVTDFANS